MSSLHLHTHNPPQKLENCETPFKLSFSKSDITLELIDIYNLDTICNYGLLMTSTSDYEDCVRYLLTEASSGLGQDLKIYGHE